MGNNLAAEVAYAASALARVALTPELEVYERAVTKADPRGQVCPSTGGTGFRAFTWLGSDLSAQGSPSVQIGTSAQIGISAQPEMSAQRHTSVQSRIERSVITVRNSAVIGGFSVMNNVQPSKPRTGYCALSGTG